MRVRSRVASAVIAALVVVMGLGVAGAAAAPVSAGVTALPPSRMVSGDGNTQGKCLEIDNGGTGSGVHMRTCHGNAHQSWYLTLHTGGVYAIRSHDTDARGKCLTAPVFAGNPVRMADCSNGVGAPQAWARDLRSDGWFMLDVLAYTEECLDVAGNGLSEDVQTWLCGPLTGPDVKGNQLWKITS
jgi:hypothetical protein